MNKIIVMLLLFTVVALSEVPEASARSEYLTNFSAVYGDGSCAICHVNPAGGGTLTSYGSRFAAQPNYTANVSAALIAIGRPTIQVQIITPEDGSTVNGSAMLQERQVMNGCQIADINEWAYRPVNSTIWNTIANSTNPANNWSVTWNTTQVDNGNYVIGGNMSNMSNGTPCTPGNDTVNVTVNNSNVTISPTPTIQVQIIAPEEGSTVNGSAILKERQVMNGCQIANINEWAYGPVNSTTWNPIANSTNPANNWSVTWNTIQVANGNYSIRGTMSNTSNGTPCAPGNDTVNVTVNNTNVTMNLFETYQNASYVAAGIGVGNTGRGTISLRLPDSTTLIDAWLYWKILNSTAGIHDNEITVNGIRVKGTQIGSGPSPCWAGNGYAYRANINSVIQSTDDGRSLGFTIGGMSTLIANGTSPWDAFDLPASEDVGLVIIFNDPQNPTSTVTIFDGYSEHSGGITMFNQVPVGTNMYSSIIGDGQVIGVQPYTKSVSFQNGPGAVPVILQNVTLNGVAPSLTSRSTYQGSLSDTDTFILPSTALSGATLIWNLANDCVAYDALVFQGQTNVTPTLTNMTPTSITLGTIS